MPKNLFLAIQDTFFLSTTIFLWGCLADSTKQQTIESIYPLMAPAEQEQLATWSLDNLADAKAYWESLGSTAVVIVQNGYVIAEWGATDLPVECYSVRKSLLSALYGTPVQNGSINLDDTLQQLNIDDSVPPSLSENEKQATVEHLLMSRSGVYHPAAYETTAMQTNRPERESHEPGTYWYYNNWDFNALGTIFSNSTGTTVFEAFYDEIAIPTQMEHFTLEHTKFVYDLEVSDHPAYTFQMSARDRARFGLLFLNEGRWGEQQVIPSTWIEKSTVAYSDAGSGVGYGYMWWISVDGWHLGSQFDEKPYSARGNHGQYIVVIPERDLLIVQTVDRGGGDSMQSGKTFNELFALILAAESAP